MSRLFHRRRSEYQGVFSFVKRTQRRDRQFRATIVILTAILVAGIVLASPDLRSKLAVAGLKIRDLFLIDMDASASNRAFSDEELTIRRSQQVLKASQALEYFFSNSSPEVRALFEDAGMAPGSALNRWTRGDKVFMFSSEVFEVDNQGRSYRFKPETRSVWLRELRMKGGPHGLLLIPDRPELRRIASKAGAIVVEESVQNTNSWGLRGPEPNLNAKVRILVLGDSFMQGMFIGDQETPPVQLEAYLSREWKSSVSVLNTGHVGYSPEQYYYTFLEYMERFRPQLLVISVCHNDFGEDQEVLNGKGTLYGEAAYWLNRIIERCRGKNINFLIVPVPHQENIDFFRSNGHYPGHLFDVLPMTPKLSISLQDNFINENLRLKRDEPAKVAGLQTSGLYNASTKDGHFSALGSSVWAKSVGTRIMLLIDPANLPRQFFDSKP